MTPAERRWRLFLWRRRLKWLGLTAAVLALLVGVARPAARAARGWQARRIAAEAHILMDAGDWTRGTRLARDAYQLRFDEPEAIRAAARATTRENHPEGLFLWEEYARRGVLRADDWRAWIGLLTQLGQHDRAAARMAEFLPTVGGGTPRDRFAAAWLDSLRGRPDEAAEGAHTLLIDPTAEAEVRTNAALLLTDLPRPAFHAEAWAWIEEVAKGSDAPALLALTRLAARELALPADAPPAVRAFDPADLARRLKVHPGRRATEYLLALDLEVARGLRARDAAGVEAALKFGREPESEDFTVLARWLVIRGDFERALAVVPLERARLSRALAQVHLDALFGLARWTEARALVSGQFLPLEAGQADVLLAVCHTRLGEESAAANRWRRARNAVAGRAEALAALGALAEQHGAAEAARAASRDAVSADPHQRGAWARLVRLADARRDAAKTCDVLAEMRGHFPDDPVVAHDFAWMSALANREPAEAERLALLAVEREPRTLPFRATLALARLRQGRAADAETALAGTPVESYARLDGVSVTPSVLAVRA